MKRELDILIKRVQQKDPAAERALFNMLVPKLLTACRRYATDDSQAKDHLQESMIKLFSKINQFDLKGTGSFEGWAHRLCINTILSSLRTKKKIPKLQLVDNLPEVEENIDIDLSPISDELLLSTIQELPEKYRLIINLRIFENYSHEEIGQQLGIKTVTSRSHFMRAKKMLKEKLSKYLTKSFASG